MQENGDRCYRYSRFIDPIIHFLKMKNTQECICMCPACVRVPVQLYDEYYMYSVFILHSSSVLAIVYLRLMK